MKYQVLISLKNNEKIFMNVVCSSRNWRFKGYCKRIELLQIIQHDFFYKKFNKENYFVQLYIYRQ